DPDRVVTKLEERLVPWTHREYAHLGHRPRIVGVEHWRGHLRVRGFRRDARTRHDHPKRNQATSEQQPQATPPVQRKDTSQHCTFLWDRREYRTGNQHG